MSTKEFLIKNKQHYNLCQSMLKVLNCNSLWIMYRKNDTLTIKVTDDYILKNYIEKKYYLYDRIFTENVSDIKPIWNVTIGTDLQAFNKCGFLYELYKIFHVEEFACIEKKTKSGYYHFRFFTRNNRFVFMNKLINDLPLVKFFINSFIKYLDKKSPEVS